MSWMILSLVLTGVSPTAASPQPDLPAVETVSGPAQTGAELRQAVQETLRRWARASDKEAAAAAREYLALFNDLSADDKLPRAERDQLKQKLRSRLTNLVPQINKRAAIDRRLAQNERPASVGSALVTQPVLAQFGGVGGGMGVGGAGGMMGGWGAQRQPVDDGQQLVDLIQRTIAPTTWSVNGGPGAIYYWQPGRALVISATDGVHEQLGDVLGQLRRAGN